MKSLRTGVLALLALGVTGAHAEGVGDRSRIADRSYAAPTPNWSGFYVGGAVGYGIGASEFFAGDDNVFDFNLKGTQGVVAVGYDFQLSPTWVLGLFADYAFGEVGGSVGDIRQAIDDQWAIGARLGLLATTSTLLHASAGYTAADFESRGLLDAEERVDGFFVGLGFEQAFSRNLSLKLDYRFSDYGEVTIDGLDFENEVHSVRLGLNYRFAN